jgi:amino acid adenylation domain-containing protein
MSTVEDLKQKARAGDLQALQQLRDRGFFNETKAAEGYPVSHAQRRLWIVDQMVEGFGAYNIPIALELEGGLNRAALRGALQAIVRRHESLRTTFAVVGGAVRQFVHEDMDLPWEEFDLSDDADRGERARRIAAEHASRPFDLARGPLLRAGLVRLAPDRHLFLFNIHHIVSDLASLGVLVRELSAGYEAVVPGRPPSLPLPVQYKDFAAWQNRLLAGDEAARHRAYWHSHLAAPLSPLHLPADFARPPLKAHGGKVCRTVLDAGLTERARQLGLRHGMTLFMVLAASLKVLLHRYTGQEDIIIGFPLAGRDHPDLAGQIGCFVNTVALRDCLTAADSFASVLGRVRQTMLGAYEHQVYPFDQLVEELDLPRDMSRSPVFDVSVGLANAEQDTLRLGELKVSSYDDGFAAAKFDLSFDFYETSNGGLELAITYRTDLFGEERVRHMAAHYVRLTACAVAHPEQLVSSLPLMSPEEEHRVLVRFNETARPFPDDRTIVDLFEHQAEMTPDAVAVSIGDSRVCFDELNRRANRVCGLLKQYGVAAETMVGVFMEASIDLVSSLLGILKAGGVYLPLDPANPPQRLAAMLDDARVPVILTQASLAGRLPALPGCGLVLCDRMERAIADQADGNPVRAAGPDHAAYVIFTSGSTGRPKGAVLLHRGLANMVSEQARLFEPGPGDRILQFAALGFDASVFEMAMALASGASLCLAAREQLMPGAALLATLEREEISIVLLPPSALAALPEAELPKLRIIAAGGEACPAEVVRRWAPGRAFFNLYGPTEATVFVSAARCEPAGDAPSIGRPIGNTRIYLLDRQLQPVPLGVPGELCIAGIGLARHYLGRLEMTEARFVSDPFDPMPGGRLYRTGDLARHLPDGSIEFLGRIDDQVKLRGYRIEPSEIEAALAQHPAVREAVVLAREAEPGRQWLVAYATPRAVGGSLDPNALRRFLRDRLPEYMVPARFVLIDEMPLTTNKKIDRKALPAPDVATPDLGTGFVIPRDELEQAVAGVFAEVLRIERVGADSNFFELGGDSLLATRIVSQLRDAFRADITIPQLFRAASVGAMAEALRSALPAGRADKIASAIRRLQRMSVVEKQELLEKSRTRRVQHHENSR